MKNKTSLCKWLLTSIITLLFCSLMSCGRGCGTEPKTTCSLSDAQREEIHQLMVSNETEALARIESITNCDNDEMRRWLKARKKILALLIEGKKLEQEDKCIEASEKYKTAKAFVITEALSQKVEKAHRKVLSKCRKTSN